MADLASQPTSIQSVYSMFREDKLYVNRRYQRKLVWTLEEKQKLIESILKKYPIPAILIAEREDAAGTFEIIDGLQRLHAIVSFIETAFGTLDGKGFDLQHFTTAKLAADEKKFEVRDYEERLTQKEIGTILDYTVALSVMRNASDEEINDVFGRINTYGHRLSDQERRQAGVQNEFSNMVRDIACTLRGDVSSEELLLKSMPSISIDLPKTQHGYEVQAGQVFWVEQGILRATDLRDSMDEQCIADIGASIIGGAIIDRSKDALDEVYISGSEESDRIMAALEVYGHDTFAEEFKFCVDEIIKLCEFDKSEKLRDIIFSQKTTNAFPSIFAILMIAFHELMVKESKKIVDYGALKKQIVNLTDRIETGRKATSPEERRKNVDSIKGLINSSFIVADMKAKIYGNHATTDIEGIIRRSEIELSDYELKQGLVTLSDKREIDEEIIGKVVKTICAIANNGPTRSGKILIGVADKASDVARIKKLDGVEAKKVGRKFVVGVDREAKALGITTEAYFAKWKDGIKNSDLSAELKTSVLSNIDYNSFYGLGVLVISVPPQKDTSYVGEHVYWRNGDSTVWAENAKDITAVAKRF